jgi:O-antigen biosynthesis protein
VEGWLEALLEPFADPSVEAVTGNVLPADPQALEAQLLGDLGQTDHGPHRHAYDGRWLRSSRRPPATWRIGGLGNAAVRRSALQRLGPFRESLGAEGAAEYVYRILRAGGRVVYQPTAVVLRGSGADQRTVGRQLRVAAAEHVAYHLEILARYGDVRGLFRIALALPRQYLRRGRSMLRSRDSYRLRHLTAEVGGSLGGVLLWLRSRRQP